MGDTGKRKLTDKRKRQIRNVVLFFLAVLAVAGIAFGILAGMHVLYVEDGAMHFNTELFYGLRSTPWIYPVYIAVQIVVTTLLCFVPGTSAAMIGLAVVLFGAGWRSFVVSAIGVYLSSFAMYAVGRFGGRKAIDRLIGREDADKAAKLLREHGDIYFPVCLACAGFPDDALVMMAGVIRMNFLFFTLSVLIGRGIGIACICWGMELMPRPTTFWELAVEATVCCFWLCVVFYASHRLNVYVNRKKKEKEESLKEENGDGGKEEKLSD